jgi:hypothetical protein
MFSISINLQILTKNYFSSDNLQILINLNIPFVRLRYANRTYTGYFAKSCDARGGITGGLPKFVGWALLYVPTRANISFPRNQIVNPSTTPIHRINPILSITMKCRIWPFADLLAIPMLHRVVMNVIHVPDKIGFIANLMFPIPTLP